MSPDPARPGTTTAALRVVVRRSERRRRTVSARVQDGDLLVFIPARFTAAQEREWVQRMQERIASRGTTRVSTDARLQARARVLSQRYLGGKAVPVSVRWSTEQHTRWGSCTPATGRIRLSTRLADMPSWVIDYVLLHELAHLLCPGHGPDFWALLSAFPRLERARGYLEGVADSSRLEFLGAGSGPAPPGETETESG